MFTQSLTFSPDLITFIINNLDMQTHWIIKITQDLDLKLLFEAEQLIIL